MSKTKTRMVIVEDELLVSGVLQIWLRRFGDLELVGSASDGEAGLELCRSTRPDLALIDVGLPELDGLELAQRLMAEFPEMGVVSMSSKMDPHTIWRVMQSGVHGYVNKSQPPDLLVEAIRSVAKGNTFFGPEFAIVKEDWLSQPDAFQKILSDREQQVLRLVANGCGDTDIGNQLGISTVTVESHRKHIRQKIGVRDDRGLLAYARRWGLDSKIAPVTGNATRKETTTGKIASARQP